MSCIGSTTTTENNDTKIEISVSPEFVKELSLAGEARYTFSYEVEITNYGKHPVRLLEREWIITCSNNTKRYVRGKGVVGEQPRIDPQTAFGYTSFLHLPTPVGFMQGHYLMRHSNDQQFNAMIDMITLSIPGIRH